MQSPGIREEFGDLAAAAEDAAPGRERGGEAGQLGFILSTVGHSRMWTLDCRKDRRVWLLWPGSHLQAAPGSLPPPQAGSGFFRARSLSRLSDQGQWAGPPPRSLGAEAQAGEAEGAGRKRGA